jgi:transglutaminase-like putative cysteine protease
VLTVISQLSAVKARLRLHGRFELAVQISLFFGSLAGIFLTYRTLLGVEAGVSFLLLCLIAKLLEVRARRDVYIVLTLSLFVLSASFLFSQELQTTLLALLGVLGVLYAMIAQNDDGQGRLRSLLLLSGQALPLMVILFLFFPRLPPLWSVNLSAGQGQTGMSDVMSPGDIADLSQSTELAFRAFFEADQRPAKSELYWRGLVLSQFDGRAWTPQTAVPTDYMTAWTGQQLPPWVDQSLALPSQTVFAYRVSMEPTQREWLFALNLSYADPLTPVGLTRDYTLQSRQPIYQRQALKFVQYRDVVLDTQLPDWLRQLNLQLPNQSNPQSQAFAQALWRKTNGDPDQYMQAVLAWIRQQNFVYTLQPPRLAGQRVDQFLFETRRGFCEHYSSAFTFLMRSAGIPARVVVGYQGGQAGRDGQSWEVRQMDAHAWSEVWLPKRGWVRVDPTAAVAPERIEQGMGQMTSDATLFGDGAAGQLRYQQFKLLGQARELMDYAGYLWQRDVVGFDQDKQTNQLFKWFGLRSMTSQLLLMFGAFSSIVACIVLVLWWRRRPVWHVVDRPLVRLSKRLQRKKLHRLPNEGVLTWLQRVGAATDSAEHAKAVADCYQAARYLYEDGSPEQTKSRLQLRQLLKDWPKI